VSSGRGSDIGQTAIAMNDPTSSLCFYQLPWPSAAAQVKVKRRGSDKKFVASVLAVGTECDIGRCCAL
jgi:hypothetical protein